MWERYLNRRVMKRLPTMAFLVNDPEVGPLLRRYCRPFSMMSRNRFIVEFGKTNWFNALPSDER